jgi:uroporphyrin-III C-methyltransferase
MARLMEGGVKGDVPVAVIQDGSSPSQRVVISSLDRVEEDCRREGLGAPAVIVVGKVVELNAVLRDLR